MKTTKTFVCKVCKATFIPLTKEEEKTNICYVCNDIARLKPKDLKVDDGLELLFHKTKKRLKGGKKHGKFKKSFRFLG